jgi:hypothetical protein
MSESEKSNSSKEVSKVLSISSTSSRNEPRTYRKELAQVIPFVGKRHTSTPPSAPNHRQQVVSAVNKINIVEDLQRDVGRSAEFINELQQRVMTIEDKQMEILHYLGKIADILQENNLIK